MGERDSESRLFARETGSQELRRYPVLGLAGLLLLAVMAVGFWVWPAGESGEAEGERGASGPDWAVTFTQPERDPDHSSAPEELVIDAIDSAEGQIDIAIYSFTLPTIRDALLRAYGRGVQIRIVMESDNLDEPEVGALRAAGISVRSDERDHLMHHKFMVVDRSRVWIGSMNFTYSGARLENNSGIMILNEELAEDMLVEFEEMYLEDRFGQLSLRNTPFDLIQVDGRVTEVLFAPEDLVTQRLVQIVRGAQESVQGMAFILTSDPIAGALVERSQAGVPVRLVLEAENANAPGSDYLMLLESGVDIRLDSNPYNMHHKVLIVDDRIVALGSFNYTRSAQESNDESLLLLHNPEVLRAYRDEFERVYGSALP